MKKWKSLLYLSLLMSCTPSSLEDLRAEAETEMHHLKKELLPLHTKEEVERASERLRRSFLRIAELIVESKKFPGEIADPPQIGEELFAEFARLYEIPGVREEMERVQLDAMRHLARHLCIYTNEFKSWEFDKKAP